MKTHSLKCWREPFEAVLSGRKTFEYRRDDRGFCEGDEILLCEWDPSKEPAHSHLFANGWYTGRKLVARVSYILHGGRFGVPEGYVVMSLCDAKEPQP